MKLKIKFTVVRVAFGILFMVIHWTLFYFGTKTPSAWYPNPIMLADMILAFPAYGLTAPLLKCIRKLLPLSVSVGICTQVSLITTTIYVFALGFFVGVVIEDFLKRSK